MALIVDYTAADFNSYITEAEADDFMITLEILGGTISWADLSTEQKEAHIINAVRQVNSINWNGTKSAEIIPENMQQPRDGMTYPSGTEVPGDEIAEEIKKLTACYAYRWIKDGTGISGGSNVGMVKTKKVGDVSVTYETGATSDVGITAAEDSCLNEIIPNTWTTGDATLGGIGTIGMERGL